MNQTVTVTATPAEKNSSEPQYLLDCSVCGPLHLVLGSQVDLMMRGHMTAHGCDLQQVVIHDPESQP